MDLRTCDVTSQPESESCASAREKKRSRHEAARDRPSAEAQMKRKPLLVLLVGGAFCVAMTSLYRMLELMQGAELQAPAGPLDDDLSRLQQQIERLERLLGDNNRLVATLQDSLAYHRAALGKGGVVNVSSGSAHSRADTPPGCRLAEEMKDGADGVQVSLAYMLTAVFTEGPLVLKLFNVLKY
ncbi:Alpha-mannosidase 2 [Liparis tanakae]|uniref:Alpha-mannosidase 2 n=1 Tax=Liparis tanakae TaxID=230148 RepID=A0A4Z2EHA4_9TELE|nr:Alpha-mannosidase 2 [Liparis tanakae]